MKKVLLFAIMAMTGLTAFADLDGFYRVQNAFTKRYAYLLDNHGSYSVGSTTADVGAIELYKDLQRRYTDPASILYISKVDGDKYSYYVSGQSTSVYGMLGTYLKLYPADVYDGAQTYKAYASKSGLTKYLSDNRTDNNRDKGMTSVDDPKTDKEARRLWYIKPIDADTDEYFGIAPTVTAGGKYYYPFFADLAYKAKSEGMAFYIVTDIDPVGAVVVKKLDGAVSLGVPIIIECSNPLPSDNRLSIGFFSSEYANTEGNKLAGVYFDNDAEDKRHYNRTPFDKNSMRVLGEVDGKLAFVRGDYDFIPRNQAYLPLPDANLHEIDNFLVMTADELEEYKKTISGVNIVNQSVGVDVYSIDGRLVNAGMDRNEVNNLGKGVYILRSGNKTEKLIVK